ncbi:hypothetical protein [uncultured Williamsia sp.]|uniref:hypothetical protein n=1 Tax=uncultured Williamsia sp. TaxID=259311 RepID=UPI00262CFB9E|nr:hypothetical protein [uncultured Williamsia sp.]
MDGGDKLTVRSADLFFAAHQVDEAQIAFRRAASSAYGAMRGEAVGWVGDSKRALEEAVQKLEKHSKEITDEMHVRADRIRYAARHYESTERRNAERLRASGNPSGPGLNMDH